MFHWGHKTANWRPDYMSRAGLAAGGEKLQGGRNENYKLKANYFNKTFSALAKALAWFSRNISVKPTQLRAYRLLPWGHKIPV